MWWFQTFPCSGLAADTAALELESDYPYTEVQGQCTEDASKKRVTVLGGQTIQTSSEEQLKQYLAQYGPLSISKSSSLYQPSDVYYWT